MNQLPIALAPMMRYGTHRWIISCSGGSCITESRLRSWGDWLSPRPHYRLALAGIATQSARWQYLHKDPSLVVCRNRNRRVDPLRVTRLPSPSMPCYLIVELPRHATRPIKTNQFMLSRSRSEADCHSVGALRLWPNVQRSQRDSSSLRRISLWYAEILRQKAPQNDKS